MASESVSDTSFYKLINEIVHPSSEDEGSERRQKLRLSYPSVQSIAPYVDGNLPLKSMFRPVQCQDISTTGLAFFLPEPPTMDRIVVALSTANNATYLTAAICHYKRVAAEQGEPMFLVGCRFLGRVVL
jgi:hypothetical protein